MQIDADAFGNVAVIALAGRLTVNETPGLLKQAVEDSIGRGATEVVLDLSGVNYIDSTRLGELIAAHVTASRLGGRLKLACTPPRIVQLLRISGLDGVFERFDSIDDATASLQAT